MLLTEIERDDTLLDMLRDEEGIAEAMILERMIR